MTAAESALRRDAERAAATLPPLLAEARRAAASVYGDHGRRMSGPGESFWQYRRAMPGDSLASIDWRRSARSDELFVRETEWEAAQTVWIWPDRSAAMRYASSGETKGRRAKLLALALSSLLVRAGERFGVLGAGPPRPRRGEAGLRRAAFRLAEADPDDEYGAPPAFTPPRRSRAVFLSDFFGPLEPIETAVRRAADAGVSGTLMQIVDPSEEAFPWSGRVLFESVGGRLEYDAEKAESIAEAYKSRLEARRAALRRIARSAGWRFAIHRTDAPPQTALLWLHGALDARRRAAR